MWRRRRAKAKGIFYAHGVPSVAKGDVKRGGSGVTCGAPLKSVPL